MTQSDNVIIKLNVGGSEVLTYRSTLMKYPHSKLCKMLTHPEKSTMMPNEPDTYFIDYSYDRFQYILDFLRTDEKPMFYSVSGAQNFKIDLAHFGMLPFMDGNDEIIAPTMKPSGSTRPKRNKKKKINNE